ncbi:hypothetical protein OAG16_03325 [Saprospiraceae bacterium]|nr:hypothetical protein [Saprospiraceae bacterium]
MQQSIQRPCPAKAGHVVDTGTLCAMKMKKAIKILPLIVLAILSVLLMTGRVRFGLGLADIIYHGLIYIGFIIYGIYFIAKKEVSKSINLIFPILSIVFCGYLILSMTIWRGGEYRWNGDILAPTQKTREKRKQEKFEKRLAELERQIEKNPKDYDLRVDKGFFLRSNGKYELAIEVLKEAQEIAPENYKAYWEAGYAYSLMKDYENTIREYEKAYQADTTKQKLKSQIGRLKEKYQIE